MGAPDWFVDVFPIENVFPMSVIVFKLDSWILTIFLIPTLHPKTMKNGVV